MNVEINKKVDGILSSYKGSADLLPILQAIQKEFGYLPQDAMERVAWRLRINSTKVYSVATFYEFLRTTPAPKKTVSVCNGMACHLKGSDKLLSDAEAALGVKKGETNADGVALHTVPCAGVCHLAPVVEVDEKTFVNMTADKIKKAVSD